ncbi:MmcQ/YjbR family DNA-binding protein [Mucilaginibacter myungsuensis]|uniref:MmcQ/YjbR family DNA-binding protein n=1 Tax=Mucilaginibacter myungsuensis TaxID=649104 RepID=A0A929L4I1_9SPHI|nr:MmcQ/YjbR family DNA-binding protein [Mucilaginibacter myungsuensis]MBE9663870.1 MmcQ/YjbR family DNA-binding protein [Mucilaginibacter myungsuensis]
MQRFDTLHWLNIVRKILLSLPGVEEYSLHNTPGFRVKKKLLARVREDGVSVAIHSDNRDVWMQAEPEVFFIEPHYFKYSYVLLNLQTTSEETLSNVLTQAWKECAPKRMLQVYIEEHPR